MNAYDAFSASQRKLEGTAKLTGVALSDLKDISKDGVEGFKLSTITANDFAAEIAKLTSKAGDLTKSKDAMASFLDIGAARGLTASDTLKAVQQAILGIDEGTDKLFGKNPSVLYEEYADKVGKSAGKLSDQEKALALLDATMQGGELVRGSYQDYLGSAAGLQEQLTTKMDTTKVAFGTALQPVRTLVLQGLVKLVEIGTPVVLALGRIANFAGVTLGLKFQDARIAVGGFAEVMGKLTRSESLEAWGRAQVKASDRSEDRDLPDGRRDREGWRREPPGGGEAQRRVEGDWRSREGERRQHRGERCAHVGRDREEAGRPAQDGYWHHRRRHSVAGRRGEGSTTPRDGREV